MTEPSNSAGRSGVSSRISPFGLVSALFASSAVVAASLSGTRSITIALALTGLAIGLIGFAVPGSARRRVSIALGGLLCAVIVLTVFWAPWFLNPLWSSASPAADPNELVAVPRSKTRSAGRPLQPNEFVNGASEGLRQDDLFIQLQSVIAGRLPDKGTTEFLLVNLRLDQMRDGRPMKFERFIKGKHNPKLTDDSGREYAFLGDRIRKAPSKLDRLFLVDQYLIFELPEKAEPLNLEFPASAWGRQGVCRFRIERIEHEPAPELAKMIADVKSMLRQPPTTPPERTLGRALFQKNCQECHTLFGAGGKTGPDLTASKRDDLDFLLTSIINPSAVIEKKYQPTIVVTTSGQVHNGIIQKEDDKTITLLVPSKLIVVAKDDIEEMRASSVSIMPTDLLREFKENDIRSLIAYLTGKVQTPMLATAENAAHFFPPAQDLTNWHADGPRWTIDKGVLATPEPAAGQTPLLTSDLLIGGDFHLGLRFNPGKNGRSALLIGDASQPDISKAIRIELAAGKAVVFNAEGQTVAGEMPEETVKPDAWNKLEVIAAGNRIQVRLNDKNAAGSPVKGAERRVLALEGAAVSNQTVLFRNLDLQLLRPEK